jgi:hypothetical protein
LRLREHAEEAAISPRISTALADFIRADVATDRAQPQLSVDRGDRRAQRLHVLPVGSHQKKREPQGALLADPREPSEQRGEAL